MLRWRTLAVNRHEEHVDGLDQQGGRPAAPARRHPRPPAMIGSGRSRGGTGARPRFRAAQAREDLPDDDGVVQRCDEAQPAHSECAAASTTTRWRSRAPRHPNLSPTDTPPYRALAKTLRRRMPYVTVTPAILTGFSDSLVFRRAGLASYGFSSVVLDEGELFRIHGIDERISLENVRGACAYTELLLAPLVD
jgi:hypothetical protein